MSIRFSPQTIEALALVISGGSANDQSPPIGIYRSGPKLESFMRGFNVSMTVGSGSRLPALIEALERANQEGDQTALRTIVERAADPRDFLDDAEKAQAVVDYLNARLSYDGLELQRVGGSIRLGTPGRSSRVVDALADVVIRRPSRREAASRRPRTDHVTVFVHTSEHDCSRPQRSAAMTVDLPEATNDTVLLTNARRIWRDGFAYSRAGIITTDLVQLFLSQRALPGIGQFDRENSAALMSALDRCNERWGRGTVVLAAAGFAKARTWSTKFEMRSPRYTTSVDEVMAVA